MERGDPGQGGQGERLRTGLPGRGGGDSANGADSLVSVHRRIALAAASPREFRDILPQIAELGSAVLPLDAIAVILQQGSETLALYSSVPSDALAGGAHAFPRESASAVLRPPVAAFRRIDRMAETLDPGAALDRVLLRAGYRSALLAPLPSSAAPGEVLVLARREGAYRSEHEPLAEVLADLLLLALFHGTMRTELHNAEEERERARGLEARVEALKHELERTQRSTRIVGDSEAWKEVLVQAAKVAPLETTVLLTGESGTGKELVARFIHQGSPRERGPFVAINCAALQETLLESELFGHERGAFTGATSARIGRIEQAAGGVLFLDEVGEMSPGVQAKLLRVLQEREYERLGGTRVLKADARVVAATNADLEAALSRGAFREDLYYRLRVFEIRLPSLRERREDILPMAEAFLEEIGSAVGRPAAGISREARETLLTYPWPGNVRELRNALERATILCDGGLITLEHLPIRIGLARNGSSGGDPESLAAAGVTLHAVERDLIVRALEEAQNNRSAAARLLGITRAQLYSRMQKHGIHSGSGAPSA